MAQHTTNKHFLIFCTLTLTCIFLLNACSHVKRPDGPPSYHVNVKDIPDAVPKPEPLAKYGNMRSYVVFGKRYYVMPSSQNYEATGTASWYGTKFHAHKTSSGEPYDMLAMTAAHKTLPLPTYVEVTNLRNQKSVIVKVNDRGPFVGNRLIDLSYVAAKKLGVIGHGTAKVKIRAINPRQWLANQKEPSNHIIASNHSSRGQVYLQVGAFQSGTNANKLKQRLAGFVRHPVNISAPSSVSHLYRVKIGPFNTRHEAMDMSHDLKRLGINTAKVTGA